MPPFDQTVFDARMRTLNDKFNKQTRDAQGRPLRRGSDPVPDAAPAVEGPSIMSQFPRALGRTFTQGATGQDVREGAQAAWSGIKPVLEAAGRQGPTGAPGGGFVNPASVLPWNQSAPRGAAASPPAVAPGAARTPSLYSPGMEQADTTPVAAAAPAATQTGPNQTIAPMSDYDLRQRERALMDSYHTEFRANGGRVSPQAVAISDQLSEVRRQLSGRSAAARGVTPAAQSSDIVDANRMSMQRQADDLEMGGQQGPPQRPAIAFDTYDPTKAAARVGQAENRRLGLVAAGTAAEGRDTTERQYAKTQEDQQRSLQDAAFRASRSDLERHAAGTDAASRNLDAQSALEKRKLDIEDIKAQAELRRAGVQAGQESKDLAAKESGYDNAVAGKLSDSLNKSLTDRVAGDGALIFHMFSGSSAGQLQQSIKDANVYHTSVVAPLQRLAAKDPQGAAKQAQMLLSLLPPAGPDGKYSIQVPERYLTSGSDPMAQLQQRLNTIRQTLSAIAGGA